MKLQATTGGRAARWGGMALTIATVLIMAPAAHASLIGEQIFGSLTFSGTTNFYDPANGLGTPGFENTIQGPLVTISGENTFGAEDKIAPAGYNLVAASFANSTATSDYLTIASYSVNHTLGMLPWEQKFTSTTPGLFDKLVLIDSQFSSLSYSLSGDTITLGWIGLPPGQSGMFNARFLIRGTGKTPPPIDPPPITGVPEPASWAVMVLGLGGAGAMLRRRRDGRAILLSAEVLP